MRIADILGAFSLFEGCDFGGVNVKDQISALSNGVHLGDVVPLNFNIDIEQLEEE